MSAKIFKPESSSDMNEIIDIFSYSSRTLSVKIKNEAVALRARPGNFVIIRFSEDGLRIPFSIVDADIETGVIEIIIHRAEGLDEILQYVRPGNLLPDLLGPLGRPAPIPENKRVLFCGDGAGFVSLLSLIKAYHHNGCKVTSVMSEKSGKATCLSDDVENYSDRLMLASDDRIYEIIDKVIEENHIEKVVMSAPTNMMKNIEKVAARRDIPADCMLNMIMIDGIGLCGICRVTVGGERKQTCIDGPVFDAHAVDFDQLLNRQRLFE